MLEEKFNIWGALGITCVAYVITVSILMPIVLYNGALTLEDLQVPVGQASGQYSGDPHAQIRVLSTLLVEINKTCNARMNAMNKTSKEREVEIMELQKEVLGEGAYSVKLEAIIRAHNESLIEINKTCEARVNALNKSSQEREEALQKRQELFMAKMAGVDSRQDFMFLLIHRLGFMKLDTWGPVVLFVAVLEAVLLAVMCLQRQDMKQLKQEVKQTQNSRTKSVNCALQSETIAD